MFFPRVPFKVLINAGTLDRFDMGGYQLAKAPSEISVWEILESAEGSLTPVSCMDNAPNLCEKCNDCITLPIYEGLYDVITKYFQGITLEDILHQQMKNFTYTI